MYARTNNLYIAAAGPHLPTRRDGRLSWFIGTTNSLSKIATRSICVQTATPHWATSPQPLPEIAAVTSRVPVQYDLMSRRQPTTPPIYPGEKWAHAGGGIGIV